MTEALAPVDTCNSLLELPGAVDSAFRAMTRVHSSALGPSLLAQYGEWDQLRALDPAKAADKYPDVKAFAVAYQAAAMLDKDPTLGPKDDSDREAATLAKWLATEERCRATNDRFADLQDGVATVSWMGQMRSLVAYVLNGTKANGNADGEIPFARDAERPSTLSEVLSLGGFGPGAMVGFPGFGTVLSQKYGATLTVTPKLLPFVDSMMPKGWINLRSQGVVTAMGNEWFWVPKSADIFRPCAKEPALNSWLQMGIGRTMRRRLKRHLGVDLRSQAEWNRYLMTVALDWDLVTIDLSSASDLLATMMCLWFLPEDWGQLMNLARSEYTSLPDEQDAIFLEKFCSMGNGFTFPLQTLLFTALVRTTVPAAEHWKTSVFGDDMVVPRAYAEELINRLEYLGLQVNIAKTHLAGGFRESCGVDTFQGADVRPSFRKDSHACDPIAWANAQYRWLSRMAQVDGMTQEDLHFLEVAWLDAVRQVPREFRIPGPQYLGDSVIAVPPEWVASMMEQKAGKSHDMNGFLLEGPFSGKPVRSPFLEVNASAYLPGNQAAPSRALKLGFKALSWDGFIVHKVLARAPIEMERKTPSVMAMHYHRMDLGAFSDVFDPLPFEQADSSLPETDTRGTKGMEPIRGELGRIADKWSLSYWPELASMLHGGLSDSEKQDILVKRAAKDRSRHFPQDVNEKRFPWVWDRPQH